MRLPKLVSKREWESIQRHLNTKVTIRYKGEDMIVGTLEEIALIAEYGGYTKGENVLSEFREDNWSLTLERPQANTVSR
jgi:phage gpG-like protein